MATGRAIRVSQVGGPEVLAVAEGIEFPAPKGTQVLIKAAYSGVNFIDIYHRTGMYPLPLPFTPGREGSGVVEAVGEGVTTLKKGDKVCFLNGGTYADYVLAEKPDQIVALPDNVTLEAGAASLLQGLTALTLVRQSYEVQKGDWILVHAAAGGTGALLVQLAKHFGATVIGTTSSPEKEAIAKAAGCDHVINYKTTDFAEEVKKLTGGKGVAAVYDGVGAATFDKSLASLKAPGGFMLSFGNASGKVPPLDIAKLSAGNYRLMRPTLFVSVSKKEDFEKYSKQLYELISSGVLKIAVSTVYPLDQAKEAHTDLGSGKTTGKLLIKM
ncbi:hypothetical protein DFJ74DRAFT_703434 [Hyaloraphidium curvatum]|nr:hypothetical protein DFJ74DRAFT_703434 [Hyaloraphidium curvatum]